MNQEDCKPQEQETDSKPKSAAEPIPTVYARESEQRAAESQGQRENAASLHQVARRAGFKKWLCKITVAEVAMVLLTLTIAVSSVYYTKYAKRQWKVMRDQLPELQKSAKAAQDAAQATKDAVTSARDQFRQDERPYVWMTNQHTSPEFIPWANNPQSTTGQVIWTFHITDYGKSPAYDVRNYLWIKLGSRPWKVSYGTEGNSFGTPLPPAKDDFFTIVSEPITRDEFSLLFNEDRAIRVRIRIKYIDSYGSQYETGVCAAHLRTGAKMYCAPTYIK